MNLALSFAYSFNFSCITDPSVSRNSFTAALVLACSFSSCNASKALKYRLHVSSREGMGSLGNVCWYASVRLLGCLCVNLVIRGQVYSEHRKWVVLPIIWGHLTRSCMMRRNLRITCHSHYPLSLDNRILEETIKRYLNWKIGDFPFWCPLQE